MKQLEMNMRVTAQDFLDLVRKINEIVDFLNERFPEKKKTKEN